MGGNAAVTVKLTPSAGPDGISMASEVQKIDADGSLGELLRSGSLGATVKEKIASSVESSIRKGLDLKSALPTAVAAAEMCIRDRRHLSRFLVEHGRPRLMAKPALLLRVRCICVWRWMSLRHFSLRHDVWTNTIPSH